MRAHTHTREKNKHTCAHTHTREKTNTHARTHTHQREKQTHMRAHTHTREKTKGYFLKHELCGSGCLSPVDLNTRPVRHLQVYLRWASIDSHGLLPEQTQILCHSHSLVFSFSFLSYNKTNAHKGCPLS